MAIRSESLSITRPREPTLSDIWNEEAIPAVIYVWRDSGVCRALSTVG